MAHFSKDYFDFFKELAANNNKDWFDQNRKRYQTSVKEPFEKYVTDLIAEVNKLDSEVDIQHKDAIFRINRDIRFSKDKTPYKLSRSAIVSAKGKKDKTTPGLYIEVSPEHCRVYGGAHQLDKDQLRNVREKIAANPKAVEKLMADKKFKETFGEILGEKNKIIPKEFKEAAAKFDLIANKQFYWYTDFKPSEALQDDFLKKTMAAYKANEKLMLYFREAIQ